MDPNKSDQIIFDVLIIGAGPAGLTAGYLLTKESEQSVIILEKNPNYVGGISRTEQNNNFLVDIGGHRFFSKSKEINELWQELLPNDFLERKRLSRIFYQGKFYSYPLKAFEALKNLGLFQSLYCILSYIYSQIRPIKNPNTFHEWVRNQFGERLYQIFFKSYTEKVWGLSCDKISSDWAAQRIKGLNLKSAIISAIKKSLSSLFKSKHNPNVIKTLIETFKYPRKGPGMLWEATAKKIKIKGGLIEMGANVTQLDWDSEKKIWAITVEKRIDEKVEEVKYLAKNIISSAPIQEMINAITPIPSCASIANNLNYRDFIIVAIVLSQPPKFQDNWLYVHDSNVKVGRIQNFSSWSPEMVPSQNEGCLGLEYFCREGDTMWESTDDELVEFAAHELKSLNLIEANQIKTGFVVRQPKAYPIYDTHYKQILAKIRTEFQLNYPQFYFTGRNGLHKYNNQDHSMMTAMLTVKNILAGKILFNVWAVNEDAEYHESLTDDQKLALESLRLSPENLTPSKIMP